MGTGTSLRTMARSASPTDIDAICRSLPEVELGTSWGDRPTYKVPTGPQGKGFDDLLVRLSRLGELDVDELREVLTDAWLTKAHASLAREFLAAEQGEPTDG